MIMNHPGNGHGTMGDVEVTEHIDAETGCVLGGPAAGLYAFLWNRADSATAGVAVSGDPDVLDLWGSSVRVRW
jgi:hypothetical protein